MSVTGSKRELQEMVKAKQENPSITIDLADYTSPKDSTLNNLNLASEVAADFGLNHLTAEENFTVLVPHYIYGVSTKFFDSLFGYALSLLGKDKFRKHFVFDCESPSAQKAVEAAIEGVWAIHHPEKSAKEAYDPEDFE